MLLVALNMFATFTLPITHIDTTQSICFKQIIGDTVLIPKVQHFLLHFNFRFSKRVALIYRVLRVKWAWSLWYHFVKLMQ